MPNARLIAPPTASFLCSILLIRSLSSTSLIISSPLLTTKTYSIPTNLASPNCTPLPNNSTKLPIPSLAISIKTPLLSLYSLIQKRPLTVFIYFMLCIMECSTRLIQLIHNYISNRSSIVCSNLRSSHPITVGLSHGSVLLSLHVNDILKLSNHRLINDLYADDTTVLVHSPRIVPYS